MTWESPPEYVLVITHLGGSDFDKFIEIVNYLIFVSCQEFIFKNKPKKASASNSNECFQEHNLTVYVEEKAFEHEQFMGNESIRGAMLELNGGTFVNKNNNVNTKEHNRQFHSRIRRFPTNMVKANNMASTPECKPKLATRVK